MAILLPITVFLYGLSAVLLWRQLSRSTVSTWLTMAAPLLAIASHVGLLWQYLNYDDFDHLNITTSLSTVSLFLSLLAFVRARQVGGLLLTPIIYVFAAVSVILMVISPANWGAQLAESQGLVVHIVLSLIAYAVLMLATLYAIQLLYLNYLLKHHRSHLVINYLPPLMTVERYFFRLLSTGTLLLFVSILSGFIFLDDMFAQGQAHKTILSLVAFTMYIVVLFLHAVKHSRGKSLVITSVVASTLLSLAYFGSRFVKDILLSM